MSIGSASGRRISLVRQSGFAPQDVLTPPVAAGTSAYAVRRASTGINVTREGYAMNERRADRQKADSGLGTFRSSGPLEAPAFLGTWKEIQESLLARDFTGITTITASSGDGFTMVGSTGVLTRQAGGSQSFLTDGLYEGLIVKVTDLHASVNGKLAYVSAVTATTVTLIFLDGTTATDVSTPDTNATIVIPGKTTHIPSSGFTKHFYQLEDYFGDIASSARSTGDASTVFWNQFVNGGTINIAPNSFASWSFDFLGTGHSADYEGASAPYSSSVTPVGTERAFRCSAIWLFIDGYKVGTLTSGSIQITRNATAPAVAGSDYSPDIVPNDFMVTLNATTLLESLAMRGKLRTEGEFKAAIVFQSVDRASAFAIPLPRLKITSHSIDDGDVLSETFTADALKADAATGVLATTVAFQDTSLV